MRSIRILFITTAFPPYEFSEALVNAKLVKSLMNKGHDVHVVSRPATIVYANSWSGEWEPFRDQVYYPNSSNKSKWEFLLKTIKGLLRYKLPVEGIRWGLEAEILANKLHQDKPFDVIMTRMPSLFPHMLGLRLGALWKVPVICNWNDPTDDIRPFGNKVSKCRSLLLKYISRKAFKSASLNTFPSKRLRDHYLKTNLSGISSPTEIVPHIGFYPDFELNHNQQGIVKIAHAGNMLDNINLDLLLVSFKSIWEKGLSFEFHVFGIVQQKLLSKIEAMGLEKAIIIHNPLRYTEMILRLMEFDYLMILEAQYEEGILMLSKLSDYASLGKPIIALSPRNGVTKDYLMGEKGFYVFDNSNQEEIEIGLTEIINEFPAIDFPRSDNRLWTDVNPSKILETYEQIFDRLYI
ncbi:glycosyltransferase family protein [Algoriphagus halophytocola]|uniref:Glycosyltransferase subfamily 4-like N-terminal domain-containing protein n=1 Tax=Algoriphagus halophytocola TaxID=2991499 RepID=A0ABY6MK64_9BACT|nr:hypothetical protein [Algoriphagus sp. TR-M5]UZD23056.1 hypothetical protein OM944_00890 [Algoriphagus sp. TR-M5]